MSNLGDNDSSALCFFRGRTGRAEWEPGTKATGQMVGSQCPRGRQGHPSWSPKSRGRGPHLCCVTSGGVSSRGPATRDVILLEMHFITASHLYSGGRRPAREGNPPTARPGVGHHWELAPTRLCLLTAVCLGAESACGPFPLITHSNRNPHGNLCHTVCMPRPLPRQHL